MGKAQNTTIKVPNVPNQNQYPGGVPPVPAVNIHDAMTGGTVKKK